MMCKACNAMDSADRPYLDKELCPNCLMKVKDDLRWFGLKTATKKSKKWACKKEHKNENC